MEIEYWWLLALPLFFALGWLAALLVIASFAFMLKSYFAAR